MTALYLYLDFSKLNDGKLIFNDSVRLINFGANKADIKKIYLIKNIVISIISCLIYLIISLVLIKIFNLLFVSSIYRELYNFNLFQFNIYAFSISLVIYCLITFKSIKISTRNLK